MDWSKAEVKLIIEDYFFMFSKELSGEHLNKAAHRKSLLPLLNNRTSGSIEWKHQNISAVLVNMGLPYIKGYKPRFNYQQILEDLVSEYLFKYKFNLEKQFDKFSESPGLNNFTRLHLNFEEIISTEPVMSHFEEKEPVYKPIKINYLEKEQNNRNLGMEGEKLVIDYEKWRLIKADKENLADKIEWVSQIRGDGAGFDILSKNINGSDRFIEVKTTKLPKETPIYLTKSEVSFAAMRANDFYLYRVYNFATSPQIFIKDGEYKRYCRLLPETYRGYFN